MISYEQFREIAVQTLKSYLPEKYRDWEIKRFRVHKINETLECIQLFPPQNKSDLVCSAFPMIYLEHGYQMIQGGAQPEYVVEAMARILEQELPSESVLRQWKDPIVLKENILPMVINQKKNQTYLRNLPWRPFLDLAVVYRILILLSDGFSYSMEINLDLMRQMKINESQLFRLSMENMNAIAPPYLSGLERELKKGLSQDLDLTVKRESFPSLPLYLLTNRIHMFGAAAVLCQEKLSELAESLQRDIYILPSSIHEMLLLPADFAPLEQVRDVVYNVNTTVVDKEEWLSDQVYLYCRGTRNVVIPRL